MVEVFTGRALLNKDGDLVDPDEALRNKVVGVYFSAGWCPPCRDFTPVLCDFYTELVEESDPPAQFEIVFVSSDKSSDDMVEYYHDVHGDWLALAWTDEYKHELKQRYKITAVPKLVIVKENGDVITDKGRKQIRDRGLACFRSWLDAAEIFQNFKEMKGCSVSCCINGVLKQLQQQGCLYVRTWGEGGAGLGGPADLHGASERQRQARHVDDEDPPFVFRCGSASLPCASRRSAGTNAHACSRTLSAVDRRRAAGRDRDRSTGAKQNLHPGMDRTKDGWSER
ncbi:putative nucleoredoxin-like protein 2 [Scophthalmus maximus]|uniref:Putative nucleoredoxin-like protein 2 n=1 Tax=Scophthalmus maximus TaxID=52904 RepID=A0A2U9CI64_SCOMX|nr:putative nucleoredoxin-like protein 2 [Scophthalmus maximus]